MACIAKITAVVYKTCAGRQRKITWQLPLGRFEVTWIWMWGFETGFMLNLGLKICLNFSSGFRVHHEFKFGIST